MADPKLFIRFYFSHNKTEKMLSVGQSILIDMQSLEFVEEDIQCSFERDFECNPAPVAIGSAPTDAPPAKVNPAPSPRSQRRNPRTHLHRSPF
jgi:hypothetical protein